MVAEADMPSYTANSMEDPERLLRERNSALRRANDLWIEGKADAAVALALNQTQGLQDFTSIHGSLFDLLWNWGRRREARAAFEGWIKWLKPCSNTYDALAFYARQLGEHQRSNEFYRLALAVDPNDSQLWYNFATSERALGRLAEASEACERALSLEPNLLAAVLLRSELSKATIGHNHIADLQARLSTDASDRTQMFLNYALGKELQDVGHHKGAFEAFRRGASVRRRNLDYDVGLDERKIARIQQIFQSLESLPGVQESGGGRHIFIIGMPRSGTTLTERILSALPGVRSNGETDNFSTALLSSLDQGPGDIFERAARAPMDEVARRYDDLACVDECPDRIIEKLPLNYLYAGLIGAAFPNASLIWVRRDPLDTCFAMYRTLFGAGYPFSYDLDDLARYYASYERLMHHWQTVMPKRMIQVEYEKLVSSPVEVGEGLAEQCGLSWSDEAIDLSRNAAPSLTASAAQIRSGIYSTSAGLWAQYRNELKPLAAKLAALGVDTNFGAGANLN